MAQTPQLISQSVKIITPFRGKCYEDNEAMVPPVWSLAWSPRWWRCPGQRNPQMFPPGRKARGITVRKDATLLWVMKTRLLFRGLRGSQGWKSLARRRKQKDDEILSEGRLRDFGCVWDVRSLFSFHYVNTDLHTFVLLKDSSQVFRLLGTMSSIPPPGTFRNGVMFEKSKCSWNKNNSDPFYLRRAAAPQKDPVP